MDLQPYAKSVSGDYSWSSDISEVNQYVHTSYHSILFQSNRPSSNRSPSGDGGLCAGAVGEVAGRDNNTRHYIEQRLPTDWGRQLSKLYNGLTQSGR